MTDAAFERVIQIAQEQARTSAALEELARSQHVKTDMMQGVLSAQTAVLNSIATNLKALAESSREHRDSNVREVKSFVQAELAKSERHWKLLYWLAVTLVAVSNVLGPLLTRLIEH